ncbi:hypothetical protein ON010_g2597 [Phytophthora cinnamomi]|nr:hypothetical protein ON010_g2597 [Phytophthora cinnamomi]
MTGQPTHVTARRRRDETRSVGENRRVRDETRQQTEEVLRRHGGDGRIHRARVLGQQLLDVLGELHALVRGGDARLVGRRDKRHEVDQRKRDRNN